MIAFEEFGKIVDEIAREIPEELYTKLNGGVNIHVQEKPHPSGLEDELFILGDYSNYQDLGRFINIYYGSFCRICPHLTDEEFRSKIESVLKHEFLHHLESLAGEKELEQKDAQFIEQYIDSL